MRQLLYEDLDKGIEVFRELEGKNEKLDYFKGGLLYSSMYAKEPYKLSFTLCPSLLSLLKADIGVENNILMLGTAGGGMAIQLHKLNPLATIDLVDIDSEAEFLSREFFGCNYENMHFFCQDAAEFVKRRAKKYDYIVIDIFIDDKIPEFVTFKEFWRNVYNILDEKGVVAFNNNMRELQIFELHGNPLIVLLQNMYSIGFNSVFHSDVHDGGWSYLFKEKMDITRIKQRLYELYELNLNKYINLAVTANAAYIREINKVESGEWTNYKDIIGEYRRFVFRGVMKICRNEKQSEVQNFFNRMNEYVRKEIKMKFGKYRDISYISGKRMFRSNHIEFFDMMNSLSNEMENRKLSDFIFNMIMPEETVVDELHGDSYYLKIMSVFGKHSFDRVEENNSLLDEIWAKELSQ